jgi:hypothetical protein
MSDDKDPQGDDHIEELLGQLQGIFGKLSHSEEEESQTKIDPPKAAPVVAAPPVPEPAPPRVFVPDPSPIPVPPPLPEPEPAPLPEPFFIPMKVVELSVIPEPAPAIPEPAPMIPEPPAPVAPPLPAAVEPAPVDPVFQAPPEVPAPEPVPPAFTIPADADKSAVFALIFYPLHREAEANRLTEKMETMTPKFTKVEFRIKVAASLPYDPKGELAETVLPRVTAGISAVVVIIDRALDDARRKKLTGNLESRGIYFQEVPFTSVDKKAFYTDLLLGMVFFFDSLKSSSD